MLRTAMPSSTTSGGSGSTSASTASGTASSKSKGSKGFSVPEVVKAIVNSGKDHAHISAILKNMTVGGGGGKAKRKRNPLQLDEQSRINMRNETIRYYEKLQEETQSAGVGDHSDFLRDKFEAEKTMYESKLDIVKKWVYEMYPTPPAKNQKGQQLTEEDKKALKAYGVLNRISKRIAKLDDQGINNIIQKYQGKNKLLDNSVWGKLRPILHTYYKAKAKALKENDLAKRREALRAALKQKKQDMAAWRKAHNLQKPNPRRTMRQQLGFQAGLFDLHESCEDTDDDDY